MGPCQVGQRYLVPHLEGSPRQAGLGPHSCPAHCLITWNPGHWRCGSHTHGASAEPAQGMRSSEPAGPQEEAGEPATARPSWHALGVLCGVFRRVGLVFEATQVCRLGEVGGRGAGRLEAARSPCGCS